MAFNLTYKPFGERAILIEWPFEIDEAILKDIMRFKESISQKKIKVIVELRHAYNSLLVVYYDVCRNYKKEVISLKSIYKSIKKKHDILSKLWKIPVCYDESFGIDLEYISNEKKHTKSEIVALHSKAIYTVYFVGFLPGFLYLGGLDERLYFPRKSTPRLKIEKGAVAIGGKQTGVYPSESPGGWNIIGNTPISFFDPKKEPHCFANAGDRIKFVPVSLKEYGDIKILVDAGVYELESEVIND
ncbi:5-oxoprolinase subunit PxpB [Flavobacteriaceae bacterium XHP0103]|uniref:5-oxoprolinase subunit PxpB n=1 Tax=Marixanthotalea marina TaxID=2844359 RepID=UPI002989BE6C|nr:5-oxoprolinase subunit PxpB [Marixanthotalea marina]MBU3821625.1 5-oxoprolinase subunit PxpB [Marixanthotalea marina]